MGASYRDCLKGGNFLQWVNPLWEAVDKIEHVASKLGENIGDDGQYDNAAQDGGLQERLLIAASLIRDALPLREV